MDNGEVRFETEVIEREAKILTLLPGMILEPDNPELYLEVNGDKVCCHGTGRHQIIIHLPHDVSLCQTVDLTKSTVAELALK